MASRATRSTVAIIVSGLALALVLAACSGGTKTKTAASTTASAPVASSTPAASSGAAGNGGAAGAGFQQYLTCLRSKGVPIASFSGRPGGAFGSRAPGSGNFSRPPGGFTGSRGPGGGFGGLGALSSANPSDAAALQACASLRPSGGFGGGRTISAATFAAFSSCMSDNGVTITGTDPQAALRALNRSDAKTAAALKICQAVLGQGGGAASAAPVPTTAPSAAASS